MQVLETEPAIAIASPSSLGGVAELTEKVRSETLAALTTGGVIKEAEREGFDHYLISNSVSVGDILPVMAQLRGIEEGELSISVANWARAIASIVKKRYSLVPFAGRLLGSTSIFEKHETILEVAKAVKCPMIFAEDADVIGFGTLNPVAGLHLSNFVADHMKEETGTTPYISMFLVDLPTWETICRRQFE